MHLDHCELWINPENPNELWLANDGGVYHSHDKGESWLHLNNIPTGEFYDIELSQSEPYQIYGGTQDDATVVGLANEFNPNEKDPWKYLWIDAWSGGDGCITLVDPNDPNIVYFSMQNGAARRMDLAQNKSKSIRAKFPKASKIELEYNFISPYFLSPHNSNTMYMGSNYMLKSENRGDKWELISPNLIEERGKENEIAAGAIAESKLEEGLLYFGTDRGGFWALENEKSGWTDRSAGLPSNYIRSIFPSAHNSDRVYVQLSGLNYDDLGAYLYVSEDRGESWKSIVGNLPNQPINVVVEDPFYEGVIYAGTMRGVYVSLDGGGHWKSLGNKMPDVSIGDIVIHESTKDLIVATHGRGIYKLNLTPFYLAHEYQIDKPYLFELPTSNYPKTRDTHSDIDKASLDKVNISFYLNDAQKVGLEVMNSQDSVLWGQEIVAKKGLNQFRWDKQLSKQQAINPIL